MLIFLRQSTCHVITPQTNQWYKINAYTILENHKLALHDKQSTQVVPLSPAELPEINAFTPITTLTLLQTLVGQISDNNKQPMYSNIQLVNQNTNGSHQSQDVHHHD